MLEAWGVQLMWNDEKCLSICHHLEYTSKMKKNHAIQRAGDVEFEIV